MYLAYISFVNPKKESAFERIYQEKIWGQGTPASPLSGTGSNPNLARPYVDFVRDTVRDFSIESVLDFGHGDWAMWRDYKFEDTHYLGVDVVNDLSLQNTNLYGAKNIEFRKIGARESLPDAKMLICKDVLQHLSLSEIKSFLSQILKYEFIILCNDIELHQSSWDIFRYRLSINARLRRIKKFKSPFFLVKFPLNNSEIETGGYRGVDLEASEFETYFGDFRLVNKFDFGSEFFNGTSKRVLFLRRVNN